LAAGIEDALAIFFPAQKGRWGMQTQPVPSMLKSGQPHLRFIRGERHVCSGEMEDHAEVSHAGRLPPTDSERAGLTQSSKECRGRKEEASTAQGQ
jgi:hypothetical protein